MQNPVTPTFEELTASEPSRKSIAPVRGHYAAEDDFFTPEAAAALQAELQQLGKDAVLTVHPGVGHAFFNDARPEVYDAATAELCWDDTTSFFRSTVR